MQNDEIFARCAALRLEVAELVDALDEEQLATGSLCAGWDVRTVAAHLTVLPTVSKLAFTGAMVRARGNFARANDAVAHTAARRSSSDIAATLRTHATSRAVPPRGGPRAPLTDLIVHSADIRLPLGIPWAPGPADLKVAMEFIAGRPSGFVPRQRLDGLRLVATDLGLNWRAGAEVHGAASDLLLATCGRRSALQRLGGPGAATLAARL